MFNETRLSTIKKKSIDRSKKKKKKKKKCKRKSSTNNGQRRLGRNVFDLNNVSESNELEWQTDSSRGSFYRAWSVAAKITAVFIKTVIVSVRRYITSNQGWCTGLNRWKTNRFATSFGRDTRLLNVKPSVNVQCVFRLNDCDKSSRSIGGWTLPSLTWSRSGCSAAFEDPLLSSPSESTGNGIGIFAKRWVNLLFLLGL